MNSTEKAERWNELADAIANKEGSEYDAAMLRLDEAVEGLPLTFRERARLWGYLIENEGEADTLPQEIALMAREVEIFVRIGRSAAEALGHDVYAPEFDEEGFKERATGVKQ